MSEPFKLKYTNGKKSNPSAFPFQEINPIFESSKVKTAGDLADEEVSTNQSTEGGRNEELITLLEEQDEKGVEVSQAIANRNNSKNGLI